MSNTLRVLKINMYSLLAIPFLLIATVAKLIAKAFSRIGIIFTMAVITGVVFIISDLILEPDRVISHVSVTTFVFVGAGIVIALLRVLFSVVRFVLITIFHGVIQLFDTIYGFSYSIYESLINGCSNDYNYLILTGSPFLYSLLCMCYIVICLINLLIKAFIHISLLLFIAVSFGIAGFIYYDISVKVKESFGMGMMEYLSRFDRMSLVMSIIMYGMIVADAFVILVSLGIEWKQWSDELTFNEDDLDEMMDRFTDNDEEIDEYLENPEIDDVLYEYISAVNEHLDAIEDFMAEARGAIELQRNTLLENACNEYLRNLSDISDELAESGGNLTDQDISRLKPFIRRLDRQRENIERIMDKQAEILDDPTRNSMFFTGCTTREKLDKRYKTLCRAYHPDNEGGDEDTFKALTKEYSRLKKIMEMNVE